MDTYLANNIMEVNERGKEQVGQQKKGTAYRRV